jgi:hypothetical protein
MSKLEVELNEAERKAWDSLIRYKFMMFGYWAGVWVHLNRVGEFKRANPWRAVIAYADQMKPKNEVSHDR